MERCFAHMLLLLTVLPGSQIINAEKKTRFHIQFADGNLEILRLVMVGNNSVTKKQCRSVQCNSYLDKQFGQVTSNELLHLNFTSNLSTKGIFAHT